ncbi:MAG: CDP-archaeol synthase [Flavobacteriales bacterium]|nr:CDP-archaeol synthase [Flavobacteriales bacterium]
MNNMLLRTISGTIYVLILFLGCTSYGSYLVSYLSGYEYSLFQGIIFYGLMTFLFLGTFLETAWFMKFDNKFMIFISLLVACIPYYIFTNQFFSGIDFFSSSWEFALKKSLYTFLFFIAVITVFRFPQELYMDTSKLIFLCAYIGVPFSLVLVIPESTNSLNSFSSHIFYMFLLIWISDTFAYLVGKFFGKRKLAPSISPKKTVEGLLGGIVFTIIAGIIIEYNTDDLFLKGNWIIIAFLISIFAPIGDLVASKLKREFNVKDSGFLIPGHGGLLDRLDSFIACVPVIYLYYIINYIV